MNALESNSSKGAHPLHSKERRHAFTLIELLVVIAILLVLAVTVGTALATTKPNSLAFQCRNNLRQLGLAWRMYSDDFQGLLVYNRDGGNAGKSAIDSSWAGGWLDYTTGPDNTNTDLLVNHALWRYSAYLGPYLRTPTVFKCPADKSVAPSSGATQPRVRSVSLNNCMGQNARLWTAPSAYTLYTKANQLGSPTQLFVFLDEREDSINDPVFLGDPDTRFHMVDFPSNYHDGGGNFVFADGHGETHLWTDPRTTPVLQPGVLLQLNVMIPGDVDIDWLQQHASERR